MGPARHCPRCGQRALRAYSAHPCEPDDGTAEGFAFLDVPAFSVQYHPEAAPGPTDAHYLFTAFARLMEGREDYLDIDIATDRLSGWKFGADTEREVA
ncbi:MAG: glutamine amidotransferase-related protein [Adlercreutzia equolifaciens]